MGTKKEDLKTGLTATVAEIKDVDTRIKMRREIENSNNSAGIVSGIPKSLSESKESGRKVFITKYIRGAMQSGLLHAMKGSWRIEFDRGGIGRKWENSLMGWTSTCDPLEGITMSTFDSAEEAAMFARRQGWMALIASPTGEGHFPIDDIQKFEDSINNSGDFLKPPNVKGEETTSYADNFKYSPEALRLYRTK